MIIYYVWTFEDCKWSIYLFAMESGNETDLNLNLDYDIFNFFLERIKYYIRTYLPLELS